MVLPGAQPKGNLQDEPIAHQIKHDSNLNPGLTVRRTTAELYVLFNTWEMAPVHGTVWVLAGMGDRWVCRRVILIIKIHACV